MRVVAREPHPRMMGAAEWCGSAARIAFGPRIVADALRYARASR